MLTPYSVSIFWVGMDKKKKLYEKAKNSPTNFKFNELCKLAEAVGLEKRWQKGSHLTFKHPKLKGMMNFQPDKQDNFNLNTEFDLALCLHFTLVGIIP